MYCSSDYQSRIDHLQVELASSQNMVDSLNIKLTQEQVCDLTSRLSVKCVYIFVCICMWMYVHMCVCVCVQVGTYVCMCMP